MRSRVSRREDVIDPRGHHCAVLHEYCPERTSVPLPNVFDRQSNCLFQKPLDIIHR